MNFLGAFTSWFTKSPAEKITINEAYKLLDTRDFCKKPKEYKEEGILEHKNECFERVGKVTFVGDNFGLMDGNLYFESIDMSGIEVGMELSYLAYKKNDKVSVCRIINKNISPEWQESLSEPRPFLEHVLCCQVTGRKGRLVTVSLVDCPQIDLNKIEINFIPLEGDWININCLIELNEKNVGLKGRILEIKKISPSRYLTNTGFITQYEDVTYTGVIDHKIYFSKEYCVPGYEPQINDQVKYKSVESSKGNCEWRAIEVSLLELIEKVDFQHNEYDMLYHNKNGVTLTVLNMIRASQIGEKAQLQIHILNNGTVNQTIKCIEFKSKNSQLFVKEPNMEGEMLIDAKKHILLEMGFEAKYMGNTRELIIIHFENFSIGRYIYIEVNPPLAEKVTKYKQNYSLSETKKNIINGRSVILPGRKTNKSPAFIAVKLPLYNIPEKITMAVFEQIEASKSIHKIAPEKISKTFTQELNIQNYADRFHALLYLEEVTEQLSMHRYDQERVPFVKCDDYLVLQIENLSEQRPSIIVGDRVIATKPNKSSAEEYEGIVHKTGSKHIFLKFAHSFHTNYNGEDYSVNFFLSRTTYRKSHHAIDLAIRHLTKTFLFPATVPDNKPQVEIICSDEEDQLLLQRSNLNLQNDLNNENLDVINGNEEVKKPQFKSKYMEMAYKSRKVTRLSLDSSELENGIRWFNQNINNFQKLAVMNILQGIARPLPYLIFGPPGTGKTITLVEAILQVMYLMPHSRILICTPSNSAADLIATRLINSGLKPGELVRMLAYSRVLEDNIPEILLPFCVTGEIAREGSYVQRFNKEHGVDLNVQFTSLVKHKIMVTTCMVASTLYTMGISRQQFTHFFIDEAVQATEPEIMIPLSLYDPKTAQLVLAGDPLQLGPCVLSLIAKEYGLGESFLERLMKQGVYLRDSIGFPQTNGYDPRLVTRLVYNYRSLPQLLYLPNKLFYNCELIPLIPDDNGTEVDIINRVKDILPDIGKPLPPSVVFHGVCGYNYQTMDSPSWYNPTEAAQVFFYVSDLYKAGIQHSDIGIITPYTKQCQQIRSMFREVEMKTPKIGSVEEFQGQEYQIILLSLVRSVDVSEEKDIQTILKFISSPARLNVAITRARALLIIIGNPYLLRHDYYWRNVLLYTKQINSYVGCDLPNI